MDQRSFNSASITFVFMLLFAFGSRAQDDYNEKHIEVALRMIGHQLLLSAHDSSSRVLPITREKNHYRIQFESEIAFSPEELVKTVNEVMLDTKIAEGYILEVQECATKKVVYSYEKGDLKSNDIIPCQSRNQPKSCYSILFTLSGTKGKSSALVPHPSIEVADESTGGYIIAVFAVLLLLLFFVFWRRRKVVSSDPNLITLGKYVFDKRKSALKFESQRIELTSKEADLLLLLHGAVNTTVERDVILQVVWGDDGDYIGRTLDVFISKLRKKLEADERLKIVNVRGVGYKLLVDV